MKPIVYRKDTAYPPLEPLERQRVLITGADGWVGRTIAPKLSERHDLRLSVLDATAEHAVKLQPYGEVVEAPLGNLDNLKNVFAGMDSVIHLAADPDYCATWEDSILPNNVNGTYNAMVAAKAANLRRFIYASSVHAVSAYPGDYPVKTGDPVNPGNLYGVSKVFGEALGRYLAVREGIATFCIRVCGFRETEKIPNAGPDSLFDFIFTSDDFVQMLQKCLDNTDVHFAILNGISNNRYKRLDLEDTMEAIGYSSPYDAYDMCPNCDGSPPVKDYHFSTPIDPVESGFRDDL